MKINSLKFPISSMHFLTQFLTYKCPPRYSTFCTLISCSHTFIKQLCWWRLGFSFWWISNCCVCSLISTARYQWRPSFSRSWVMELVHFLVKFGFGVKTAITILLVDATFIAIMIATWLAGVRLLVLAQDLRVLGIWCVCSIWYWCC